MPAVSILLTAAVLLFAVCDGGDEDTRADPPAFDAWAASLCGILETALLQPEVVSVSPDDLTAFFEGAAANAGAIAAQLAELPAPDATAAFTAFAAETFGRLATLLSETGARLAALDPGAGYSTEVRRLLLEDEAAINAELRALRIAFATLPAEALSALDGATGCGAFR